LNDNHDKKLDCCVFHHKNHLIMGNPDDGIKYYIYAARLGNPDAKKY